MHVPNPRNEELHHVCGPDSVRKTCVVRAGIGKGTEPELAHPSKPLHLFCFKKCFDDLFFFCLEADQTVNGIA